jgi:hypothetical protein
MRNKRLGFLFVLALISLFLLPNLLENTSFMPMEEVKKSNFSILLPKKWIRADLRVAIPEILEDYPDLQKEHDLGLLQICLLAGTSEEKPDTFLLTKSERKTDLSLLALEIRGIIEELGGKIVGINRLSENELEVIISFEKEKMTSQYIFYQENENSCWEFYFTTPSKRFFLRQGTFRKIYQSFKPFAPEKIIPIFQGAKSA